LTTYNVTGPTNFRGHKPGETFDAELSEAEEARAIARGSIAKGEGQEEKKQLEDLSRSELDAKASEVGVGEPEKLPNRAAVIDAIRSYEKE
jgi:hypothetical protein